MWRSLVARFVRDEEVAGSNPVTPTNETERERNESFSPFCVERGRGRRRVAEYRDDCDVPRHMSVYVAGFFGFLGWGFRVICPFLVGRFCRD